MQNLSTLRETILKLSAAITWKPEQARSLCDQALIELAKLDRLTQAQMLSGENPDLSMSPNYYKTDAQADSYQTGRVLHRLGVENPDNNIMKKLYSDTLTYADAITAAQLRNEAMAKGECLAGRPPLKPVEGIAGVAIVDPWLWVAQAEDTPAQARAHAVQATAERLKAECQKQAASTKRKA